MSEYDAPFTCVGAFDKRALFRDLSRLKGKKESLEKLYFNGKIDEYKRLMGAEYRPMGEKQLDIFAESA